MSHQTQDMNDPQVLSKFLSALKRATSETGADDWENIAMKFNQSGQSGGSGGLGDLDGRGLSKKDKIQKLVTVRKANVSVLQEQDVNREFPKIESKFSKDLAIPTSQYCCVTQPKTGDQVQQSDIDKIVIGLKDAILRWRKNSVVNFAVYANGW
jgi:hypothetical protein